MNTKNVLRDEIHSQVELLHGTRPEDEGFDKTSNSIKKLVDGLCEIEKLEIERDKLIIEAEKNDIERVKAQDEKKDRKIKNALTAAGLGITIGGTIAMFVYEEKGTITSAAGRKIIDRIFKTK